MRRHAPAVADRRPFRVYTRDPADGLLKHDGIIYRGEHAARRGARVITRVLGLETEIRPAP